MPIYSAHAVISPSNNVRSQEFLFNKGHEDFGYWLPGGRFEEMDIKDLEASGFKREKEISARVLIRGLKEELKASTLDLTGSVRCDYDEMLLDYSSSISSAVLETYYGWKPDDIRTKSGKVCHIDRMYFWGTTVYFLGQAIGLKPLSELKGYAKSELRIMGIPEIQSEVLSPAMKKIIQQVSKNNQNRFSLPTQRFH